MCRPLHQRRKGIKNTKNKQRMWMIYQAEGQFVQSHFSRLENSVDPDQLASEKPADLDLHCFQNRIYLG